MNKNKTVIISLSGKKGSGKNTIASYIRNYFMQNWHKGLPNIQNPCEIYAFADYLKEFCINVLGLTHDQCYGSDADKETFTECMWENAPNSNKTGPMTGREVMQIFGTECVRTWFGNVWAKATIRRILKENPALALISDNRFPDETKTVLGHPFGYIVRLTRSPLGDDHKSESALDDFNWDQDRCFVLDNKNMSIGEQELAIKPILDQIFEQNVGGHIFKRSH